MTTINIENPISSLSEMLATYADASTQWDSEATANLIILLESATNTLTTKANQLKNEVMPWHWQHREEGSLAAYVTFKTQEDALKKEFSEILALLKYFPEIADFQASAENYLAALAALAAQSNGEVKNIGSFRRITEKELWDDRCKAYQYIM